MSLNRLMQRPLAAVIAAALMSGCVTNPDGTQRLDERAQSALIGAAAGCAIAAMAGKECAKGAVAGAVVGFLVGWYFESKKIADANRVNAEYKKKGVAIPKNDVVPAAFTSEVRKAPPEADGQQEISITSNTDLIGYGDKAPEVQQKYAIYDEKNQLIEEKTEKLAAVDGAGRYQTNSKFKTPASAKGKKYTIKTQQIVNGKPGKESTYKIALGDDGRFSVALLADGR